MITVGDIEVHRIEEQIVYEPMTLFPDFQPDILHANLHWLAPHYYDRDKAAFPTSVHSWLLRSPAFTVLIDTCGGNGKTRPLSPRFHMLDTPYVERLAALGVRPDNVDLVVLTHLHVDHVGWNTRLVDGRWVPTFPNAKYIVSRTERDAQDPARGAASKPRDATRPFVDSVQPILDAGLAMLVDGNEQLLPGIRLVSVPGHTPGMMAIHVRSRGEEALFVGDVAHQPIQVAMPEWSSKYCADPKQAAATRRKVFTYCARHNCLMLPVHFGWPYCGRIERAGVAFRFIPSEREP